MAPKKMAKVAGTDDEVVAVEAVRQVHQQEDIVAIILGWLCVEEIMCSRRVCKKWREAVKKTIVPPCRFVVDSMQKYDAMSGVMTTEMPNLQQIKIDSFDDDKHKYSDGDDPDQDVAQRHADWTSHDIEIISNFSKLRILDISSYAGLNGRYPFLFNFPLLQILSIHNCRSLKWDLEMLAGLPLLKELDCFLHGDCMTGNISSLRVLKDTLEKVEIQHCGNVEGNFMDLADFPRLKKLNLFGSAVTGDIRDIDENDFSSMELLALPHGVYGGFGCELQRISDAPELIGAVHLLSKERTVLVSIEKWYWKLSEDSPDRYESMSGNLPPPFYVRFVKAGSRVGYRWTTCLVLVKDSPCEVNWLDPEPDRESSNYGQYIEELQKIQDEIGMYRGFHQPPTEEEYQRLVEEES